jgi:hypothetical protein
VCERRQAVRQSETPAPLTRVTVDAIARRVVELLRDQWPPQCELVGADEIARRLGMSRSWVYAHADELGAIRLGAAARPRLRFDPALALQRLTSRSASERSQGHESQANKPRKRRRRINPTGQNPDLLPIKEVK